MVEGDLTLGGEHTMQYRDDALHSCTFETFTIILIDVTPINSIKILKYIMYNWETVMQI